MRANYRQKEIFLMKVNKSPRCHNPHNSLTPQRLFTAKTPFQLDSIFSLHSIPVVTLLKPVHFVVMKRSRTEKSPWIRTKTKPGLNMKKIDEFHPDRRDNLAESDKGLCLNQPSKSKAAIASSLNVSAVSKKKIMESKRKQCYKRETPKNVFSFRFVLCGPWLKRVPP